MVDDDNPPTFTPTYNEKKNYFDLNKYIEENAQNAAFLNTLGIVLQHHLQNQSEDDNTTSLNQTFNNVLQRLGNQINDNPLSLSEGSINTLELWVKAGYAPELEDDLFAYLKANHIDALYDIDNGLLTQQELQAYAANQQFITQQSISQRPLK